MSAFQLLSRGIIVVLTLSIISIYATAQVKLKGCFHNKSKDDKIVIYTASYVNRTEDIVALETQPKGAFEMELPIKKPQFIDISSNESTLLWLLVFPGDSVHIDIDLVKLSPSYLKKSNAISGSNAEGHIFFNAYNFQPIEKFYTIMNLFEENTSDANKLFNQIQSAIGHSLMPLDSLLRIGKITSLFRQWMYNELAATLTKEAIKNCNAQKSRPWSEPLKKMLYHSVEPFNPQLLSGLYGIRYTECYLEDVSNGLFGKAKPIFPERSIFPYLDKYTDAPEPFNELIIAYSLQALIPNMPEGVEGFHSKQVLDGFIRNFPNSRYIPHLKQLYRQKSFKIAPDSNVLKEVRFIDTAIHYRNLKELWTAQLKGRHVFIDLWATWCQPCLREFQHADTLYNLLQQKNIDLLYISIDKPALLAAWQEKARQYGLRGTHFLVNNEAFIQYLKKEIYKSDGISVPRYLLLDNRGNLVATDLERPANMQKLLAQLENLINK